MRDSCADRRSLPRSSRVPTAAASRAPLARSSLFSFPCPRTSRGALHHLLTLALERSLVHPPTVSLVHPPTVTAVTEALLGACNLLGALLVFPLRAGAATDVTDAPSAVALLLICLLLASSSERDGSSPATDLPPLLGRGSGGKKEPTYATRAAMGEALAAPPFSRDRCIYSRKLDLFSYRGIYFRNTLQAADIDGSVFVDGGMCA